MVSAHGHKDPRNRAVWTLVDIKYGTSAFLDCVYAGTEKKNGENGASLAKLHIDKGGGKHSYVGAVVDNTSSMVNMMSRLTTMYPWLATCGCVVHVLDLFVEEVAKLHEINDVVKHCREIIRLVRKHDWVYEAYLEELAKERSPPRRLRSFPKTRYGYAYLMIESVVSNFSILLRLIERPEFRAMMKTTNKKDGTRARWQAVVDVLEQGNSRKKMWAVRNILAPPSMAIEYISREKTPASHVYPVLQGLYEITQSLSKLPEFSKYVDADTLNRVKALLVERWDTTMSANSQKIGFNTCVLQAVFGWDPAAQFAANKNLREQPN